MTTPLTFSTGQPADIAHSGIVSAALLLSRSVCVVRQALGAANDNGTRTAKVS